MAPALAVFRFVADGDLENYDSEIKLANTGSSVSVTGELVESPGKGQAVEIKATKVVIHGFADPESYPLQKKRISFEKLREIAHLRGRTNTFGAVARMRNELAQATHQFFNERDFMYFHTPIITASDCEGAGEMFRVTTIPQGAKSPPENDFFGQNTFLTVSGQLEGETYGVRAWEYLYPLALPFAPENSNTRRHLAEFWMIEPEMAFADLQDDADLAEDYLRYHFKHVLENCEDDLAFFNKWVEKGILDRLTALADAEFARITYTEAIALLEKSKESFEFPVHWGSDLQAEPRAISYRKGFQPARDRHRLSRKKSSPSTCARTMMARPSPRWMCYCHTSAKSSAVASAKIVSMCLRRRWRRKGYPLRTIGGFWIFVALVVCRRMDSVLDFRASRPILHRHAEHP